MSALWSACLEHLEHTVTPQQLNTWIRPLQAIEKPEQRKLQLVAPNEFFFTWVKDKLWEHLSDAFNRVQPDPAQPWQLGIDVGQFNQVEIVTEQPLPAYTKVSEDQKELSLVQTGLNASYTFDNFVEGKANQLAFAAAQQVANNPGGAYNPMFIYGGVGLGKTHLIHAIGNQVLKNNAKAKVLYLSSERFVQDMVSGIRHNKMEEFKKFYRSLDTLIIDDIQMFANRTGTQEEFFHTFNALLEGNKQVILTSDKYPKEIEGLEERLKSRFGWGLTIEVEPPEFEMRVAILLRKAAGKQVTLPENVAFLIAKSIRANVRDLEGALNRVLAYSGLIGRPLTVDVAKEALKDLIALQAKTLTLENIQKTVADYYKLKVADLISPKRTRTFTRPRQIAMYISKELTGHSLPEIGEVYGGRDHTTVLHACRQVAVFRSEDRQLDEQVQDLIRVLTS
jgi:chromosomal replication initiator protein